MDPFAFALFWLASCFVCWGLGFKTAVNMSSDDYMTVGDEDVEP